MEIGRLLSFCGWPGTSPMSSLLVGRSMTIDEFGSGRCCAEEAAGASACEVKSAGQGASTTTAMREKAFRCMIDLTWRQLLFQMRYSSKGQRAAPCKWDCTYGK